MDVDGESRSHDTGLGDSRIAFRGHRARRRTSTDPPAIRVDGPAVRVISPRSVSPRQQILAGIRTYLHDHFPDVEFTEDVQVTTGNVIFHGSPRTHQIEVTETFLDGDNENTDCSLNHIRVWNLARAIREAGGRLVTVATTGLRIAP